MSSMVYMIFDNPADEKNMTFLADYSERNIKQLYPTIQCKSVKEMLKFCQKCVKQTSDGDIIIFWYDFMGILFWWLCAIQCKKRKIVILNILLKDKDTIKNRIAQILYKPVLKARNVKVTVTSKEYGEWLNSRLGLNEEYTLLHDIYHREYAIVKEKDIQKNSVFCGGRNGRDWNFVLEIAKNMPEVQFNLVMSKNEFEKHKFGKNVNAHYDISQNEFLKLLIESKLVIMPLDTEAPAGLIALFQAAANGKMIITSDTMTTREYIGGNRGGLCKKDIQEWVSTIQYYLDNAEKAKNCVDRFRSFLECECSEKHYAHVLSELSK